MKNIYSIIFSLVVSYNCFGGPWDMVAQERNINNTGTIQYHVPSPTSGYGIFTYDLATPGNNMKWMALDPSLSITSGVLSVAAMPMGNIPGLSSALANKMNVGDSVPWSLLTGIPSSFSPSAHTQTASTITDFNSASDLRVIAGITGKENTITAGTNSQYWRGDKTWQALPVTQRIRVQTDASGNYVWTYPAAYPSGVIPVLSAVSESSSSTVPQGVQIVGTPTNASATFKVINLPSTSVAGLVVLGAPTAAQAYIHLTAVAP